MKRTIKKRTVFVIVDLVDSILTKLYRQQLGREGSSLNSPKKAYLLIRALSVLITLQLYVQSGMWEGLIYNWNL